METITCNGKVYKINKKGYLLDTSDCDNNWVAYHKKKYAKELAEFSQLISKVESLEVFIERVKKRTAETYNKHLCPYEYDWYFSGDKRRYFAEVIAKVIGATGLTFCCG